MEFNDVYKEYWSKLYIYGFRILQNQQVCEDLIQEIFLSFWKKRNELSVENVSAYLYQSLRFQIYKHYRDNKFTELDIEKFSGILQSNSTEELLDLKDTQALIDIYLEKLPARCREIFYLSRFEKMSHKEIAQKLKISKQTVKNQITTALKLLKENYKELTFLLLILNK